MQGSVRHGLCMSNPLQGAALALPEALFSFAAGQHGMFTTADAHRFGLDTRTLAHLVRHEVLKHPGRALYAVSSMADSTQEKWHLQVAHGATLLYDDVTFSSVTAVLAHGVPVWNSSLAKPVLLRPIARGVESAAFRVRPRSSSAVETPWGPSVPLGQALVEHCLDHGIVQGVVSADYALHEGRITYDELSESVAHIAQWPRSGLARAMIRFVNPAHESVAETLANFDAATHGIELVPQVQIHDENGRLVARVDFVVKGTKVVLEVDGRLKYTDRDALFAEKKREDRLRALGYTVVRVTWSDIMRPGVVAEKIRAGLRLSAA